MKHVQVSNNKANQYGWTNRRCTYGCPLLGLVIIKNEIKPILYKQKLLYNKKVREINYIETISKTINTAKIYNILRQVIPIFHNSICKKFFLTYTVIIEIVTTR